MIIIYIEEELMPNPNGRPLKYKTPELLKAAIEKHWADIKNEDGSFKQHPTMTGLAAAIGMDRSTLVNYSYKDEFIDTIKKARGVVESYLENHLFGSSVTGAIFNLKNNFGWKDKQEIEHADVTQQKYEEWLKENKGKL